MRQKHPGRPLDLQTALSLLIVSAICVGVLEALPAFCRFLLMFVWGQP